jgi:hypothetical protein
VFRVWQFVWGECGWICIGDRVTRVSLLHTSVRVCETHLCKTVTHSPMYVHSNGCVSHLCAGVAHLCAGVWKAWSAITLQVRQLWLHNMSYWLKGPHGTCGWWLRWVIKRGWQDLVLSRNPIWCIWGIWNPSAAILRSRSEDTVPVFFGSGPCF